MSSLEITSQVAVPPDGSGLREHMENVSWMPWSQQHLEYISSFGMPAQMETVLDSLEQSKWYQLPTILSTAREQWNGTAPPGFNTVYELIVHPYDERTSSVEMDNILSKRISNVREQYLYALSYQAMMKRVEVDVEFARDQNPYTLKEYELPKERIDETLDALWDVATYPLFTGKKAKALLVRDLLRSQYPESVAIVMREAQKIDILPATVKSFLDKFPPCTQEYIDYLVSDDDQNVTQNGYKNMSFDQITQLIPDPNTAAEQYGQLPLHVQQIAQNMIMTACWEYSTEAGLIWDNEVLRAHYMQAAWIYLKNLSEAN